MLNQVLIYSGSAFILFWGVAHLFPTRSIVSGFGEISVDNKRIITMEWIIEGIALIFIGTINSAVTAVDHTSSISLLIYLISGFVLIKVVNRVVGIGVVTVLKPPKIQT